MTESDPRREALKRRLQEAAEFHSDDIYFQDGVLCCPTGLETRFPDLDWQRLLDLYADSPGDWSYIIAGYLDGIAPAELEENEEETRPPLRRIGTAPDLFTGRERPVYNREPEPGEELPPEAETKPVPDPE